DLLRASQHLEDVATESTPLGRPRQTRPADTAEALATGASADWAALREAVLAVLEGQPDAPSDEPLTRRIELCYESLKTELLRASARGRLSVDGMEESLLRARRLQRVAESALKARRRLAPWIGRIDAQRAVDDSIAEDAPSSDAVAAATPVPAQAVGSTPSASS